MKNKQLLLLPIFMLIISPCFAQLEKTIHQTFILDGKSSIQLDLYGEYTIIPWASNNVLVETNVKLFNSSASIFKHFIEKDLRYQVDADTTNSGMLKLISHDKKRTTLRTKSGAESTEVVETKVFVPDTFIARDERTLVLEAEKN